MLERIARLTLAIPTWNVGVLKLNYIRELHEL